MKECQRHEQGVANHSDGKQWWERSTRERRLMAKKMVGFVKLQIPAGRANPAPPVGTALGPQGINIMAFCKEFNARTQSQDGTILPVEVTIFSDKSFTFITKTPPAAMLLKKEAGVEKGSGTPNKAQGRKRHARAGAQDRGTQNARSELRYGRGGGGHGRRRGTIDGHRGQGLMRHHGKKYEAAAARREVAVAVSAAPGARDRQAGGVREVRRDRRGGRSPGR